LPRSGASGWLHVGKLWALSQSKRSESMRCRWRECIAVVVALNSELPRKLTLQ